MRNYTPKIAKGDLKHGAYYRGCCRNAEVARWNADKQKFYHHRTKFNHTFIEDIKCPEDDQVFDVFVAEEEIPTPEKEIPFPVGQ